MAKIQKNSFKNCTGLTSLIIPSGITIIEKNSFYNCSSLISIDIPETVTSIDDTAFQGASNVIIYGTPGSYAQTYATSKGITFESSAPASVVYGVKIEKNNSNPITSVTYTDDAIGFTPASMGASFDGGSWLDKFPFNSIKPVLLNSNGTVNYELSPNNFAKKVDGVTNADITSGNDGDVMIQIPKMYYKFSNDASYNYFKISNVKPDNTWTAVAFTRDGVTEQDYIYFSAYTGWRDSNSKIRSLSGKTPTGSTVIDTYRSQVNAMGSNWQMQDFAKTSLISSLFVLMFKGLNSQNLLGRGRAAGPNGPASTTGLMNSSGLYWGDQTGTNGMKFMGIENYHGDMTKHLDGLVTDSSTIWVKNYPPYNTQGSTTGYTDTGNSCYAGDGYISVEEFTNTNGILPVSASGSGSTYYADYTYKRANAVADFGGRCDMEDMQGIFMIRLLNSYAGSSWGYVGGRSIYC